MPRITTVVAVTAATAALAVPALASGASGMPATTAPIRTGPAITYNAPEVTRVRPSVTSMTQDQKRRFVRAVRLLKATPSPWDSRFSWYDNFVWWHRRAFDCQVDQAHMRPAFLPWHRQFLYMFESALQQVSNDPSVTIPYWDWTDPAAERVVFSNDFMGPNGDATVTHAVTSGPFRKGTWVLKVLDPKQNDPLQYTFLSRNLGEWKNVKRLPTVAQVNAAEAATAYDSAPWDVRSNPRTSFRNNIEGWRGFKGMACEQGIMQPKKIKGNKAPNVLHNGVHLWVGGVAGKKAAGGGTMTLNTSLNDPVFWLHHANIDRLWSIWQASHGYQYLPVATSMRGQGLDDVMWPWRQSGYFISPRSVNDITPMGYMYEAAPAAKG